MTKTTTESAPRPATRLSPSALLLVACLALVTYTGLVAFGPKPLIIDAKRAITENKVVQAEPLAKAFVTDFWGVPTEADYGTRSYRPLVTLSYAIEARMFGNRPAAFHLVDMLLHALAAVLVALLASALIPGTRWAFAAGAIFAVHPIATEAVCSAVGRADLMAATALLAALWLHVTAPGSERASRRETWAVVLIGVALLCKEYAVAFPFVLVAVDLATDIANRIPTTTAIRRRSATWGAAFGLLAAYLVIRVLLFGALGGVPMLGPGDHPLYGQPFVARAATALWLLVPSLRLLVAPYGLNYFYGFGTLPVVTSFGEAWRALLGAGLAGVLLLFAIRRLVMRRDPVPAIALALLLLPLAPTLNTFSIAGVLFAERFLYVPAAGLALFVAYLLHHGVPRPVPLTVARVAVTAVVAVFAALTVTRVGDWESKERLARSSLAWYPEASNVMFELGLALGEQGKDAEARDAFKRSLELQDNRPAVWKNYAVALGRLGKNREAAEAWQRALALSPPDLGPLWRGLGQSELRAGRPEQAVRALTRAHELMPDDPQSAVELARALLMLGGERLLAGHADEAHALGKRAVETGVLPPEGMFQAALLINRSGDVESAKPLFAAALEKDPELLRNMHKLALEFDAKGEYDRAAQLFREILVAKPDSAPTYFNLGNTLMKHGKPAEAIGYLEAGLQLKPDPRAKALLDEARRQAR